MLRNSLIALALLAGSSLAANAAADDKAGGDGLGPNLFGVVGRKAATRPGFAYSAPLRKSGIVWSEATLAKWAGGPARMVPGTKMMFAGITSKKQQADVAAYLATLK